MSDVSEVIGEEDDTQRYIMIGSSLEGFLRDINM